MSKIKFIDLFAGMGGFRIGFETAAKNFEIETECTLTSEIKPIAIEVLKHNFNHISFNTDITNLNISSIDNFDILMGGFPCQAFSSAGNRDGFFDTRGTLFFEIERILKEKKPFGFILENVEGLVKHDSKNPKDNIGQTLATIISALEYLNYKVSWKLLNSKDFGLAQDRKRIYIVGTVAEKINLDNFPVFPKISFKEIQEYGLETIDSFFTQKILSHYSIEDLYGKAIKDKRGGDNNINSWDIGLKGEVSEIQKFILRKLLRERRKKCWADKLDIEWMDGMPLTFEQIKTFICEESGQLSLYGSNFIVKDNELKDLLDDLVEKGYLAFENPKSKINKTLTNGNSVVRRSYDQTKPKGYNIITGKLSFEFSKILDKNSITPTLVAADVEKLGVVDGKGIRRLSLREGLRLFGYPESYSLEMFNKSNSERRKAFDLLGNTVAVPVIREISSKIISSFIKNKL